MGASLTALAVTAFAVALTAMAGAGPETRAHDPRELRAGDGRGGIAKRMIGNFAAPTYVAHAPGAPRFLYVVETGGRVRVLRNGNLLGQPFLDIRGRVSTGGERGLLSIAFDPHFRGTAASTPTTRTGPGTSRSTSSEPGPTGTPTRARAAR